MSRLRVVPGIVLALSAVTCNHWGPLWVMPDVIYVVPRTFSGWICVDFDGTAPTHNGTTRQVSDYASAGPQELLTIRQAITSVGNSVHWADSKTQPACPAV